MDRKLKRRLTRIEWTFALTPKLWRFSGLTISRKGRCGKSVGYKGQDEIRSGVVKSVRIGRLSLESAPVSFWPIGAGHDKTKFQLNVGNGSSKTIS